MLRWIELERWPRLAQLRPSPRLETRRPAVVDKIQRFKFGGDGDLVEASFAVTLPVQIGDNVGGSWQHCSFDFSTVALSASVCW